MDGFERIYNFIWSVGALSFGILMVLFRNWFIKANSQAFLALYKRTNFYIFKIQSEEMNRPIMHLVVVIVGMMLIISGIQLLLGN